MYQIACDLIGGINKYDFKNQCTPLTNRGVERTNKSAVEAVVDWVQVTFHITPISAVIEDVIGLPITLFKKRNSGIYFYNRGYEFSNIKLYYSSDDESMGIHLQLTGTGCREFEHHLQQLNKTWQDFLINVYQLMQILQELILQLMIIKHI